MKKLFFYSAIATIALSLNACSAAKEQLGLNRTAPDEFAVVKRAPLEMPPDYYLRPPQPGASRPQERAGYVEAEAAMFGEAATDQPSQNISEAESVLLENAGAQNPQPNIRRIVDSERGMEGDKDKPVAEKLLGLTLGDDDQEAATVVDAKAEAERLRNNASEGKSVSEGETPTRED